MLEVYVCTRHICDTKIINNHGVCFDPTNKLYEHKKANKSRHTIDAKKKRPFEHNDTRDRNL